MNAKVICVIVGVIVLILMLRSCQKQERRATLHAIGANMPNAKESSVSVSDDADTLFYTTKGGKTKGYSVDWKDGKPKMTEFHW